MPRPKSNEETLNPKPLNCRKSKEETLNPKPLNGLLLTPGSRLSAYNVLLPCHAHSKARSNVGQNPEHRRYWGCRESRVLGLCLGFRAWGLRTYGLGFGLEGVIEGLGLGF